MLSHYSQNRRERDVNMRATVNNSALSKGFKGHYDPVKGGKEEEM